MRYLFSNLPHSGGGWESQSSRVGKLLDGKAFGWEMKVFGWEMKILKFANPNGHSESIIFSLLNC